MRVIEQQIVAAMKKVRFKDDARNLSSRDYVWTLDGDVYYQLHGTRVIQWKANGSFIIRTNGWRSNTTKSRINAILDGFDCPLGLYQKDFAWYWNPEREFEECDTISCINDVWELNKKG